MNRFWQIDFLRGIAIFLVLLRHTNLSIYTNNIGWIGVDLFFGLSGFLITNLLLEEYRKNGFVNWRYFFIRRALKIYPLYFIILTAFAVYTVIHNTFEWKYFIAEFFFFQNYYHGFGWSMFGGSWSLAIEEHFYFGIAIIMFSIIYFKVNYTQTHKHTNTQTHKHTNTQTHKHTLLLYSMLIALLIAILVLRVIYFYYTTVPLNKQFTMTHLRIDTILWGVLLAVLYNKFYSKTHLFFRKNKAPLFAIAMLLLGSFGFVDNVHTAYVHVFGFSLIGCSFFIIVALSVFLNFEELANLKFVNFFSSLGLASYSIYLTHPYLIQVRYALQYRLPLIAKYELLFSFIFLGIYIVVGYFIYYFVERRILLLKNRFRPKLV